MLADNAAMICQPTIGVLDDNEDVRHAVSLLLEAYGWNTQTYTSGDVCIESMKAATVVDALVIDLNANNSNGMQVQRVLQNLGLDIPVVIFSSMDKESVIAKKAIQYGAAAVLQKPYDTDQLVSTLKLAMS
jgi:two-component system response regulator FixJ